MADAVPGDTVPGDPELHDIDPALFDRLVAAALPRVLPTDRPWAVA